MLALVSSVSCELPSLAGRDRRVTTRHRQGLGRERNTEVPLALVEQQKPRTRIRWKIRNNKFIKENVVYMFVRVEMVGTNHDKVLTQ